ncbi:MAG: hypothetical protein KatS3mg027_2555 [Bacteroidia bacterium]|nr:MAG: hypothetical protein KatS3mg027_2555 [Bacteroidia bacterium]
MKSYLKKIIDSKNYITLKQAAEISGYSPDYIGQLIRQGKIAGKQVYCNIAWVTTEEEIKKYLETKAKGKNPNVFRGHYLQIKHNLSDWLFSFSPTLIVKSIFYSFLVLSFIIFGLLFLINFPDKQSGKIFNPEITRFIEYDRNKNKVIETTELPYLP